MISTKADIFGIRHFMLVLFLMLTLFNYGNVGYYFAPVILVILIYNRAFQGVISAQYMWLVLFSITYCFFATMNYGSFQFGYVLRFLLLPALCYVSGRLLVEDNPSQQRLYKIIMLLVISFSLISILSVLINIRDNGFLGLSRNMALIGLSSDLDIAATGINARMLLVTIGLGLLFAVTTQKSERYYRILGISMSVVALFCVLRLGSRTGLMVVGLSILSALVYNFGRYTNEKRLTMGLIIIGISLVLVNYILTNDALFSFYGDRMDSDEYGIDSGGGRTGLWIYYGSQIFSSPLGGMVPHPYSNAFAHNLWIDTARVAGIVPLAFLILFSVSSIKSILKILKNSAFSSFFRTWMLIFAVAIFAQFMVEPVLEGMPMLFMFFCLLMGMMSMLNSKFYHLD